MRAEHDATPAVSDEAAVVFSIPRWLLQSAMFDVSWSDPPTARALRDILAATAKDPVRMQIVDDAAQHKDAALATQEPPHAP